MLSSLAVLDLLVGAIVMPIYATVDFLIVRQVWHSYICMLYAIKRFFGPLLSTATLHHLTIIAWERYVAIQKCMDYKRVITDGRLKKIVVGTWLSALFPALASGITAIVIVSDRAIMQGILTGWTAVETVCLFFVAFFYRKVYLEIRNRKLDEISRIDVLMKAKLESKVAKTTGLLTAGVISSTFPIFLFAILGNSMPLFRSNAAIRFTQIVTQLNSLFNPMLYCYRDKRFRDAIRKLFGMKKSQAIQSVVFAAQPFLRKDPFRSSELHIKGKFTQHLTRSVSCNLTDALDSIQGTPSAVMLKKSLSAPTLDTCGSSLHGLVGRGNKSSDPC